MALDPSIAYVGVNDHDIDLFEGMFEVPEGMAYNSYVIHDEACAVVDSVDARFTDQWFANLDAALEGKSPDYLVVQHMEPDHSGSIARFAERYPDATIVGHKHAFVMMKNYFGTDYADRQLVVTDGSELNLGGRTLKFLTAKNVHWPEVIFTYDPATKTLFSADAFGKFGALDVEAEWACEARRYYFGIVGRFGWDVQNALAKVKDLELQTICPLHGPVLDSNLDYYLDLYNTWSSYGVESDGVAVCYTSVYGHTKEAAETLAAKLTAAGCPKVALSDLARDDMYEAVEDAFRYGTLILCTTTYYGTYFPIMAEFVHHLKQRNYQNRTIGIVENGTWFPQAAKALRADLEELKDVTILDEQVSIRGSLNQISLDQMDALVAKVVEAS